MNIFYTASFYGKDTYQKNYDLVLEALESFGHNILSPEKGNYLKFSAVAQVKRGKQVVTPNEQHYLAIKSGIRQSDAVVIEVSYQDLQLGHEATLAIESHKPVLCLSIYDDFSKKIFNPYFYGAKYNEYTIYEVLEEFINKIMRKQFTERFNMFLSPQQVGYLKEKAKKEKNTASAYLRGLIEKDQEED